MDLTEFLDRTFAGNTVAIWLWLLGTLALILALMWLAKVYLLSRMEKVAGRTRTQVDDLVIILIKRTRYALIVWIIVSVTLRILVLPARLISLLGTVAVLAFLLQLGIWANGAIEFWLLRYTRDRHPSDAASITTFRAIAYGMQVLAWTIVVLLALDNFGVDVTALITGLGIGGVAIALAVQNILGDLLAALAIVLDKPFVIGDFIIVGSEKGTVEQIGMKTTRLRSLDGEQIIFSNAELLQSRIRNYKRMDERRVLFRFGVLYSTPQEKVEMLPNIAREAVLAQEAVRFDRAHFASFNDSSLDVEVVYYVLSPDYAKYMDTQQAINLILLRRLREENVEFAFPTRTVHVEGWLGAPNASPAADAPNGTATPAEAR
ncbi:MAG: mechanosensitive ion channel family protein [Gemmatimonadaceae bacterium]